MLRHVTILIHVGGLAILMAVGSHMGAAQPLSDALNTLTQDSKCSAPGRQSRFLGDRNAWRFVEEVGKEGDSATKYAYESRTDLSNLDPLRIETSDRMVTLRCLKNRPNCFYFSKTFSGGSKQRSINSDSAPNAPDTNEQMYSFCNREVATRIAEAIGSLTARNGPSKSETIRFLNRHFARLSSKSEYKIESNALPITYETVSFYVSGRVDIATTETYIRVVQTRSAGTGNAAIVSADEDYRFLLEDVSVTRWGRHDWKARGGRSAASIRLQCLSSDCIQAGPMCSTSRSGKCNLPTNSIDVLFENYEHLDRAYRMLRHLKQIVGDRK
jgi:hypothetical protein